MIKICSKCNEELICLANDIANCNCSKLIIPAKVLEYIKENYANCLCNTCITELIKKMS